MKKLLILFVVVISATQTSRAGPLQDIKAMNADVQNLSGEKVVKLICGYFGGAVLPMPLLNKFGFLDAKSMAVRPLTVAEKASHPSEEWVYRMMGKDLYLTSEQLTKGYNFTTYFGDFPIQLDAEYLQKAASYYARRKLATRIPVIGGAWSPLQRWRVTKPAMESSTRSTKVKFPLKVSRTFRRTPVNMALILLRPQLPSNRTKPASING